MNVFWFETKLFLTTKYCLELIYFNYPPRNFAGYILYMDNLYIIRKSSTSWVEWHQNQPAVSSLSWDKWAQNGQSKPCASNIIYIFLPICSLPSSRTKSYSNENSFARDFVQNHQIKLILLPFDSARRALSINIYCPNLNEKSPNKI